MNLTYMQFKNIVEGVQKKINWDLRLSFATLNADIKDQDFPLYTTPSQEDQVFRLSDALKLQNLSGN